MGSDTASPPTPPPLSAPSPSTTIPSVPLPHPTTPASKLALENQSLKRRLIQYASTLEKLTVHARREIDASARARDEALSSAASTASLRDSLSASEAGMAAAQAATVSAMETIAARDARISELEADKINLEKGRVERDTDRIELIEARERVSALSREATELRDSRRDERQRADYLQTNVVQLNASIAKLSADNERLQELERLRREDTAARTLAETQLADVNSSLSEARIDRDKHVTTVSSLRTELSTVQTELSGLRNRAEAAEQSASSNETRARELVTTAKSKDEQSVETIAALRTELDQALSQLADTKSELDHVHVTTRRQLENDSAVRERDQLRANVSAIQDELEQSTELLTRAAIDALSDKERIRKLEESIAKNREDLQVERSERRVREQRVEALTEEIHQGERELVELRAAKRQSADELHRLQMHINEQESFLASKSRSIDELALEQNSRTTEMQKITLELSNARNALAKKENDAIRLHNDYEDICKQLKQTAAELEQMHGELAKARRELTTSNDQIAEHLHEQERAKATLSELQVARRQLQELTTLVTEKDEELTTMKRWYTNLKSEAGEASREKKRLSDMLSDVTNELKRANQELDILRSVRKDQEHLAARISHIGETSTRELSAMKQNQNEQARELAKNTVQEYHDRLSTMQVNAKNEIAATVTEQLRDELMPHLMRIVDSKAKHMVHALAKHVESFTIDAVESEYYSTKAGEPSNEHENVESVHPHHTNVATASGASQSQFVPVSSAPSEPPSGLQSVTSNRGYPSDGMYGSPAASHESPHDVSTGVSVTREAYSLASPEASIGASNGAPSLASPAEPAASVIPPEIPETAQLARGLLDETTVHRAVPQEEMSAETRELGHEGENNTEDIETINIADDSMAEENVETFYIAEGVVEDFIATGEMEGVEIVDDSDEDEYDDYEPDEDEAYIINESVPQVVGIDGDSDELDVANVEPAAKIQDLDNIGEDESAEVDNDVEEQNAGAPELPAEVEGIAEPEERDDDVIEPAVQDEGSDDDVSEAGVADAAPTGEVVDTEEDDEDAGIADATTVGDLIDNTIGGSNVDTPAVEDIVDTAPAGDFTDTTPAVDIIDTTPVGGIVDMTPVEDSADTSTVREIVDTAVSGDIVDTTIGGGLADTTRFGDIVEESDEGEVPEEAEDIDEDGDLGHAAVETLPVDDDTDQDESGMTGEVGPELEPIVEEVPASVPIEAQAEIEDASDKDEAPVGPIPMTRAQAVEILTGGGLQNISQWEAYGASAAEGTEVPSVMPLSPTAQSREPFDSAAEPVVGNTDSRIEQEESSESTATPGRPLTYDQGHHIETIASEELEGDEYLEY